MKLLINQRQHATLFSCFSLLCTLILIGCSGGDSADSGDSADADSGNPVAVDDPREKGSDEPEEMPKLRRDGQNLSIVYWNVESGGNDPERAARDLTDLGKYHIIALSEVDKITTYKERVRKEFEGYDTIEGKTGVNREAPDDHLVIFYDPKRLYLVAKTTIEFAGDALDAETVRHSIVCHFRERSDDTEFFMVLNHFEDDAALVKQQTDKLTSWIKDKSAPVVALGTFNFGYNFATEAANETMDSLVTGANMRWVRPLKFGDTQWIDEDGDGADDSPDCLTDFGFVAFGAKKWPATCRVLGSDRDFPDSDSSSNHRPIELLFQK